MPEDMPEDMPDRMPDNMPEDLPDRMPEDMPEDMPDHMPEDMPDRMSNRMSEDMSDRMPEDLPVRKCINVMVGITRSKVIFFKGINMDKPSTNYGLCPQYPFFVGYLKWWWTLMNHWSSDTWFSDKPMSWICHGVVNPHLSSKPWLITRGNYLFSMPNGQYHEIHQS